MKINLDRSSPSVKKFFDALTVDAEGVEVELSGRILCKIIPPTQLTEAEKASMLKRLRERIRECSERNKKVPARVTDREVREAMRILRSKK